FVPLRGIDDLIYPEFYESDDPYFRTPLVEAAAVQSDGKVILGGVFTQVDGLSSSNLVRLQTDGTVDSSFVAWVGSTNRARVRALAIQADGKILAGGDFTVANSLPRRSLARFNSDGTLDTSFIPSFSVGGVVHTILIQPNGTILVGGQF